MPALSKLTYSTPTRRKTELET